MTGFPERIPPVAPDAMTPEQAGLVGEWKDLIFSQVLANHPRIYAKFVPYLAALVAETDLPARDRQIVCLRMLSLCGDVYERTHHIMISAKVGLSEAEIAAFQSGEGACLTADDRAVLAAVEELWRDQNIADATWAALGLRYSRQQCMEFVFLAGCYHTMAMLTKSFGMQLEPDLASFNALREYAD